MSAEAAVTRTQMLRRNVYTATLPLMVAFAVVCGCGVQEHLHSNAGPVDTSNDFGPSTAPPTGTAGAPASPPGGGGIPQGASGFPAAAGAAGQPGGGLGGLPQGFGGVPQGGVGGSAFGGAAGAPLPGAGGTPMVPPTTTATPPSGVTITLGTSTVAKEDLFAFIHIGHSNMAGRAITPTATRPYFFTDSDPHAWMYKAGSPPRLALEPYTAEDDMSGTYGGPGTAIVKEAAALAPTKWFMSLGFGKESAYCSQFLPGALYYDSLIQAPIAIKDRVTFTAIVITLGITERHGTAADVTGFSTCINTLVTAIRKDVGVPDLPLLMNDYEQNATGALAVGQPFPQSIIPEINKIPSVVTNSALVSTAGLTMQDDHHFDFDGHKLWVSRMLQTMKDKGWAPWSN